MSTHGIRLLAMGLVAAGLVAGCGGSGGGGGGSGTTFHTITGTITGSVIDEVPVGLRGDLIDDIVTDENGVFTFQGVPAGTYAVVPELTDVTFLPPNRIVQVLSDDVTGVNFVSDGERPPIDSDPPENPVRLVFVQHSDGANWLQTGNGGLGDALAANNYYVRDVSYGWSAANNPGIGSTIDIGHWWTWFSDQTLQGTPPIPRRDHILMDLYLADTVNVAYDTTLVPDPGGENEIIVLMSPYPNSDVKNDDAGQPWENLQGEISSHPAHTVTNCKQVYDAILVDLKTQTDKLFVLVTPPPRADDDAAALLTNAGNARWLNDYLVHDWLRLADWEEKNVAVFDFFNVLTDTANHHWVSNEAVRHVTVSDSWDYTATAYQSGGGNSHPNTTGNQKGTAEFVELLNVRYRQWKKAFP